MKFVKSAFLMFGLASVLSLGYVDNAVARVNSSAGHFWNVSSQHPCREGCYCEGGTTEGANGINVSRACSERWSNIDTWSTLHAAKIYLCPSPFIESDEESSAATQCYDPNCGVHNKQVTCPQGKYLPKEEEDGNWCTTCPAGHECPGGTFLPSCTQDQGKTECSGDLYYATMGQSACSPCDGAGQRIFKSGVLNIDCQTCPDGKYALADHSDCADCPKGYKCTGGIRIRCGFDGGNDNNQYQDATGQNTCKTCTGQGAQAGMGVLTTTEDNVQLHTGCATCPNGRYSDNGICRQCELGHYCVNGTKTPCAKGYYAATRGRYTCSPCGTHYTTEGTGATSASACIFVGIRLKKDLTEIKFPSCLLQGDVNTSVIR